jgi:hypothetical protein
MAISTPTTVGQVLTSAYVNNNINSGLVYVSSTTVGTGVSTVAVNNCFSSTYDSYKVIWHGGNLNATTLLTCYMGTAPAGTSYQGARTATNTAGTIQLAADSNNSSWVYAAAGTLDFCIFSCEFHNPFLAKTTVIDSMYTEGTGASGRYVGFLQNTTSYTGFTLDPNGADTMTGGTITVYGYRKA